MRGCAIAALLLLGCAADPGEPVELQVDLDAAGVRLSLVPAPGWRINALLPPAFEPADGGVVRLGAAQLSADSAYYLVPPSAVLPGRRGAVRGTLRASICAVGEQVCRPYVRVFDQRQAGASAR